MSHNTARYYAKERDMYLKESKKNRMTMKNALLKNKGEVFAQNLTSSRERPMKLNTKVWVVSTNTPTGSLNCTISEGCFEEFVPHHR